MLVKTKVLLWMGLCCTSLVLGQGRMLIEPPKRPTPRPLPIRPLEMRALNVAVTLEPGTAVTEVEQVFYNAGSRPLEGTYLFPLPDQATIESFTMFINGVETPAELLDAKKASQIYRDIVRRLKDPALLEAMGGGLFKLRVFPIEARSEKKIRLVYRQVITPDSGLSRYQYPLGKAHFPSQSIGNFSMDVDLRVTGSLKTLYSPSHQFDIRRKGNNRARLSMEARHFKPSGDVELLYSSSTDPIGLNLLTHHTDSASYFWMTLSPDLQGGTVLAKDVILVLDTSGSMAGEKMEKARQALNFCIANLNSGDRFEIVRFSTEAEAYAGKWVDASPANKREARSFVNGFQAIGGTNLGDALQMAANLPATKERPQMVILITDGKPTIGHRTEAPLLDLANNVGLGSRRIFTFGIGDEINTHLLDKIAEKTRGWRAYVRPSEDLELKLSAFYEKIQAPVLANPKIEVDGVTLHQRHPHQLPDLFRGLPIHLFGKFKGSGQSVIRLTGTVNGKNKTFTFRKRFPRREKGNGFIPQLWAQRRVGYLLDQIRLNGEEPELKDEVVALAKRFGILTPYTSYLILEDQPVGVAAPEPRPWRQPFERDREELRRSYRSMAQKSGADSVMASEAVRELSDAKSLMRPMATEDPGESSTSQNSLAWTMAGGRAFYYQDGLWLDSRVMEMKTDKVDTLVFAGDAYFNFLDQFPETRAILALGQRVRFLHQNRLMEVVVNQP